MRRCLLCGDELPARSPAWADRAFSHVCAGIGFGRVDIHVSRDLGHLERYQFRFPRSKRKRIQRKWAKDPRNWRTRHVPKVYNMGGRFVMDPISYRNLQRELRP